MFRNKSVDVHQFSMVPKAEIPRSSFRRQYSHKSTFDVSKLIPIYVDEVLPGDTFNLSMTAFARLATPIYPLMDNVYLDSFFFFVPNRLVWSNWVYFMGEQINPSDSISFTIPQIVSPAGGFPNLNIFDYMGLPCIGQVNVSDTVSISALPLRAYNLIYNLWFRDENLSNSYQVPLGDGPDLYTYYNLLNRYLRPDYFTSCLPWTQKGGVAVTLPLGTSAPVIPFSSASSPIFKEANQAGVTLELVSTASSPNAAYSNPGTVNNDLLVWSNASGATGLIADLSSATAATINQIRQSFQIQKLLERDARGGTRYTEIIRAHFGVMSPDARLQRPEYLGGGTTPLNVSPVPQTSATGLTGGTTPKGDLSAFVTAVAKNGFTQSFTEHGHVLGLVQVRGDQTYQQGIRKMWSRSTRYDFYFPVFAALGEQAVLTKEIYSDGTTNDNTVFGYQERWAEYRYFPSMVTGNFKSYVSQPLDSWHLAFYYTSAPVLNASFSAAPLPVTRVLALGEDASGQEVLFDSFFDIRTVRAMPLYSVPGLIDHF